MEEEEIWKPIAGYEGKYEVSNMGRVRNLNYQRSGKVHLMAFSGLRYCQVNLSKDGKTKSFYVHRLVGAAFLPPPQSDETQINHKNGEKRDNRVVNIEYATPIANVNNPITKPNLRIRYHKEGEFERRSAGIRKMYAEHPEIRKKIWETRRRNMNK